MNLLSLLNSWLKKKEKFEQIHFLYFVYISCIYFDERLISLRTVQYALRIANQTIVHKELSSLS